MADDAVQRPEWHPENADPSLYTGEISKGVPCINPDLARKPKRRNLSVDEICSGIARGDRTTLGRAITLVESEAKAHREMAREVVRRNLPLAGKSVRVGITGVPGAGKSSFIEALGKRLCDRGHKVAVLAVDPSSSMSGGSILGDKTRMEMLCRELNAFIRPSPAGKTLGGVAAKTREAIILCEAAGYDVIFVETVGVGQSEVSVRTMVDFFLLLQIVGAGDELQGIKKGVVEIADAIVVNKADGDNLTKAKMARMEYERILQYLHSYTPYWEPKAMTCSALEGTGVDEVWEMIGSCINMLKDKRLFEARRSEQNAQWFRSMVEQRLLYRFYRHEGVAKHLPEFESQVAHRKLSALEAAERLLAEFF